LLKRKTQFLSMQGYICREFKALLASLLK